MTIRRQFAAVFIASLSCASSAQALDDLGAAAVIDEIAAACNWSADK